MRFLIRKRRTAPAVIIVALIDVLIVLVIFLLVTTTFKQVPSLHLTLPASRHAVKTGSGEDQTQIVSIDKTGLFYLGKDATPHSLEQLQAQLRALAAQNPKLKLAVNADTNAPWGRLVAVMEAAKDASITNISALTKDAGKP